MNDKAAKTYDADVEDPELTEPAIAESDGLRDKALENPENVENVEFAEAEEPADFAEAEEPADFAEAEEPADFAEAEEPASFAETEEPAGFAEADEVGEADGADEFAEADEFAAPSDIVAVEEPNYPDYATPSTAESTESTESSTTQPDAAEPLLASSVTDDFRDRWSEVQIGFVEDPQKSVAEADALLAEVTRAYQQAVEERRSRIAAVRQDGSADTEDLRSALLGYREIFTTMVSNDR